MDTIEKRVEDTRGERVEDKEGKGTSRRAHEEAFEKNGAQEHEYATNEDKHAPLSPWDMLLITQCNEAIQKQQTMNNSPLRPLTIHRHLRQFKITTH